MIKASVIKSFGAILMASLLLASIGLKEVHHLHGHEEEKHCEAEGQEQHLHGEEYAFQDCMICHFSFSEQQLSPPPSNFIYLPEIHLETAAYYLLPSFSNDHFNFANRGPPTAPRC
ncbi:MAG: hypothetical protein AAFO94_02170 [Bacteroidota bacterium]